MVTGTVVQTKRYIRANILVHIVVPGRVQSLLSAVSGAVPQIIPVCILIVVMSGVQCIFKAVRHAHMLLNELKVVVGGVQIVLCALCIAVTVVFKRSVGAQSSIKNANWNATVARVVLVNGRVIQACVARARHIVVVCLQNRHIDSPYKSVYTDIFERTVTIA